MDETVQPASPKKPEPTKTKRKKTSKTKLVALGTFVVTLSSYVSKVPAPLWRWVGVHFFPSQMESKWSPFNFDSDEQCTTTQKLVLKNSCLFGESYAVDHISLTISKIVSQKSQCRPPPIPYGLVEPDSFIVKFLDKTVNITYPAHLAMPTKAVSLNEVGTTTINIIGAVYTFPCNDPEAKETDIRHGYWADGKTAELLIRFDYAAATSGYKVTATVGPAPASSMTINF